MNDTKEKNPIIEYSISDLIDIDKVRALMDEFYELIKAPMAILDKDSNILVAVGWQRICIDFHRKNDITRRRCEESDTYIMNHLNEGKFLKYKCKNGLWDFAYPLIIEGEHLATIFLGQCFLKGEEPDKDFFRSQAEMYGYDPTKYLKALEEVPVFSLDHIQKLMNWAVKLTHLIAEQGLDNYKRKKEITRRKVVEKELKLYRDKLEILVEERTKQLTEANLLLKDEIEERIRIEEELNSEKALINDYINSLPGLFYIFDEKRFVRWNNRWNTVTGYTDEELSKMYAPDFFEKNQRERVVNNMKQVFSKGITSEELDLVTKTGIRIPYFFTGMRVEIAGLQLVGLGIDITDRKIVEEEKEQLIQELTYALDQVKQLKGLIPICSKCKKIRDDKGYWNNLEIYIEQHSDAQFSHGLCHECTEKLYGEHQWYKKKISKD